MNKWIGMGRLVRDPEVRYSPDRSMTIAKYTLASVCASTPWLESTTNIAPSHAAKLLDTS